MIGKKNKQQPIRRHATTESIDSSFDVSTYRRGTTLTSFKSDDLNKTERQKLRRLRTFRRRLAAVLAGIIIVLAFGFSIIIQFTGRVTDVTADGIELTSDDVRRYTKIIDDYFAKNSFERFSFARRNTSLLRFMEEQAPEVSAIKLTTTGIATSEAELTIRRPVAMWIDQNKTSFVDSSGVVFTRNYFGKPAVAIEDNSGVSIGGGVATSAKFLSFVGRTATELKDKHNLKVVRVVIPQGSARYVEFYIDGRSYPFKAQITRDSVSQAHDIAVMTRYVDNKGITPAYIDCRVEGKAYWK